jgi:hypothetical protein
MTIDRVRERGDVDGAAVGIGMGDELGRDIAAGAGLAFDQNLLAPDLRQPVGDDAGGRVDAAAGRDRTDDADRPAGPALRTRRARPRDRGAAEKRNEIAPSHLGLERDDFSSNRHPALPYCLSMIFSENRYPLFGIML